MRHPIYTALMLAMLGSAFGADPLVLAVLVILGGCFIYSARREQAHMLEEFPKQYRGYVHRTGRPLPRVRRGSARTDAG